MTDLNELPLRETDLFFLNYPQLALTLDTALQTVKAALKAAFKDERLPFTKEAPMKRYQHVISLRLSGKNLQVLLFILLLLLSCCS
jgi:hypothetical protein